MGWRYTVDELGRILGVAPLGVNTSFTAVSTDTRTLSRGQVFFALSGERFDGNRFVEEAFAKGAAAAVTTTPFAAGACLVVSDTLTALQRFAAYHRKQYPIPVIALTGSCGKTTAKEFAAAVLGGAYRVVKTQGNLNNEIGCPLSLLQVDEATDMAVIEMGANHRGEIARLCAVAQPTESAVTMVAPAHLEGFGNVEGVAAAKAEIMEALPRDGCFYVNADDPHCLRMGERFAGKKVRFGSAGDVVLKASSFASDGELVLEVSPIGRLRLPLPVRAHVTNVLLAVAVGLEHGIREFEAPLREACRQSVRFRILRIGPLEVLDDSYNANPASMAAALQALADRPGNGARIAVLGDMLELGVSAPQLHREAGEAAGRCGVTHLFARGPHAGDMIKGAREAGVEHAEALEDHQSMADAIHDVARSGDTLLVKGSRGMHMENVLAALRARYTGQTPIT